MIAWLPPPVNTTSVLPRLLMPFHMRPPLRCVTGQRRPTLHSSPSSNAWLNQEGHSRPCLIQSIHFRIDYVKPLLVNAIWKPPWTRILDYRVVFAIQYCLETRWGELLPHFGSLCCSIHMCSHQLSCCSFILCIFFSFSFFLILILAGICLYWWQSFIPSF